MIRIANGQGFWGDWLEAPARLVEQGPIDYLTLDYLAEVTMSILQKQKQADPNLGYARDFPPLMARLASPLKQRNIRVIANAGGVNPQACAAQVRALAPELKVAIVTGDDIYPRLDDLLARGIELRNMDTGAPLSQVRFAVTSANVYLGAFPIAKALSTGADVIITGRCADAALALAPMIHQFCWRPTEFDLLAAGTIAGHIVECGSQCTGGNSQVDWQTMADPANIGYPIIEASPDGECIITKHPDTGGAVNRHTVIEQMLYEIGDPRAYFTPDCIADFTSVRVDDEGPDRVRISRATGAPAPPHLKASISYRAGWKAQGSLVYCWPSALEKAYAADRIVRQRLAQLGLEFDEVYSEFVGFNACHGPAAPPIPDPPEVMLRIGARGASKQSLERFTRELIPLVLSGPPAATGYGDGRPDVREVIAYWPALLPREEITPQIEVLS
ncbi:acyclic terpene utilization AtuA family protein [uncultured Paludibaculum sp.]|uniref:acyclic terpene utilization AtuA family protein n=1 Tax=uncultured Paludibaculum sp. TaxID=1765020 RepID=UPI002AAB9049|nr:acyclic terpene utilization AtuA family protein [uncultured Paludibaculum sp.]